MLAGTGNKYTTDKTYNKQKMSTQQDHGVETVGGDTSGVKHWNNGAKEITRWTTLGRETEIKSSGPDLVNE